MCLILNALDEYTPAESGKGDLVYSVIIGVNFFIKQLCSILIAHLTNLCSWMLGVTIKCKSQLQCKVVKRARDKGGGLFFITVMSNHTY